MSNKSSIQGKAYEYAVCLSVQELVKDRRPVTLAASKSMDIARKRFELDIDSALRFKMRKSADAGISGLIPMESRLSEKSAIPLQVDLQSDDKGILGDVRDLVLSVPEIEWEIGISVKHNHDALKHSRLSPSIDFGKEWCGIPVSDKYWHAVNPIFSELSGLKINAVKWRDMNSKSQRVYKPILESFISEIKLLSANSKNKFVSEIFNYMLGSQHNDYYKLVQEIKSQRTKVTAFNFNNHLHQGASNRGADKRPDTIQVPTDLLDIGFKPKSDNTVLLKFNEGWIFSFRLHNASEIIEPSLKFDIQLAESPASLKSQIFKWT